MGDEEQVSRAVVSCPNCGKVEVPTEGMIIHEADMTYEFTCPECNTNVFKRANRSIVKALRMAGAREEERVKKPVVEPEYKGDAPLLTLDDIIALHFELEDDEAIKGWIG